MLSISIIILSIAIQISQGVIFDCNFDFVGVAVIGSVYSCTPNVQRARNFACSLHSQCSDSEIGRVLDEVKGIHLEEKNNLDVEFLYIKEQNLNYIPKEIEKFFPNLKGIYYHNSNLATISSEDLKPFPQLLIFGVELGDLVSLDGNLFQYNLNLKTVRFSDNKIKHIGHNLLGGLNQLHYADFYGNFCVNIDADSLEDIRLLDEQLPILCPPIEVDECSDQLLLCNNKNSDLMFEMENLTKTNEMANERITELEMENKELRASTCS